MADGFIEAGDSRDRIGRGHEVLEGIADMPAWYAEAACASADPEVFFPAKGDPTSPARHICDTMCPVREECLEFALVHNETSGVWGGMGARGRRRLQRQRGIGPFGGNGNGQHHD